MKRLSIALAAAVALWAGAALAADPTVELKLSHWVPPAHPLHPALQAWAADLEQASGGTIKSTIFPAQLESPPESISRARIPKFV